MGLKNKYKKLLTAKKIKVRVLNINKKKKYLELTVKPLLLDNSLPILTDINNINYE